MAARRAADPVVDPIVVGVIADTHALVRPEALDALAGVTRIVHAGDVGAPEVLRALARVAPVTAVRGNNDHGTWAARLPETARVAVGGRGSRRAREDARGRRDARRRASTSS
jgi:hypothetical protein